MYARKLPKNMIDINRRDPISLRNSHIEIGSLRLLGVSSLCEDSHVFDTHSIEIDAFF